MCVFLVLHKMFWDKTVTNSHWGGVLGHMGRRHMGPIFGPPQVISVTLVFCLGYKFPYYRATLTVSGFCYLLLGANFPWFFAFQRILQAEVLARFSLDYLFKDVCKVNGLRR